MTSHQTCEESCQVAVPPVVRESCGGSPDSVTGGTVRIGQNRDSTQAGTPGATRGAASTRRRWPVRMDQGRLHSRRVRTC